MSLTLVGDRGPVASAQHSDASDDALIARLATGLRRGGIRFCQWKGHASRARWATGRADIDLLVDRRHRAGFAAILGELGFKPAIAPAHLQIPGVISFLAPDQGHGRFIHVHAHFRLVIGNAWHRQYITPIEDVVLDSTIERDPFPIPAPEYEFILAVIKLTLRHSPMDAFGPDEARWLRRARPEAERLDGEARRPAVHRALARHLPEIGQDRFFDRCYRALLPGQSTWARTRIRMTLERRLRAYRRRPSPWNLLRRVIRRLHPARHSGGKYPAGGGALIALVGADGAGKSTCSRALESWLAQELATRRAHLGLPTRSTITMLSGAALKIATLAHQRAPAATAAVFAHVELLRSVCTARDRYRTYCRMRRAATAGEVVICERYPLHENRPLVGPSTVQGRGLAARSSLATWMRHREARYYAAITRPDLVLALRIDPDTASARKLTEPEAYVRARARSMAAVQWSGPRVRSVDASRPLAEVLAELRTALWEVL